MSTYPESPIRPLQHDIRLPNKDRFYKGAPELVLPHGPEARR